MLYDTAKKALQCYANLATIVAYTAHGCHEIFVEFLSNCNNKTETHTLHHECVTVVGGKFVR